MDYLEMTEKKREKGREKRKEKREKRREKLLANANLLLRWNNQAIYEIFQRIYFFAQKN